MNIIEFSQEWVHFRICTHSSEILTNNQERSNVKTPPPRNTRRFRHDCPVCKQEGRRRSLTCKCTLTNGIYLHWVKCPDHGSKVTHETNEKGELVKR